MAFPVGAVIAAAASVGSALLSRNSARDANSQTAASTQAQMDFQERMFKNRYLYTMRDMKRAGLNPILAYQQGPGTAPTGSSFQAQNIDALTPNAASQAVNGAVAAARVQQELRNLKAVEDNVKEDTYLKEAQNRQAQTQANKNITEAQNLLRQGKILDEDIKSAEREGVKAETDKKVLSNNEWLRIMGTIMRELGFSGPSALNQLRR